MLQPHNYPRLLGQALVLEPDPCIALADDDNPWAEGLFLLTVLGVAVGLARFIGGALTAASLPPASVMLHALVETARQAQAHPALEATLRDAWPWLQLLWGYGGWYRLLLLITTPLGLILAWLIYGLLAHGAARLLGGQGRLNPTLGVLALAFAPWSLLLLQVIPFVQAPAILLPVWGVLIAYRGLEVAHELPTSRAALAALLPLALIAGAALLALAGIVLWLTSRGGL